MAFLDLALTYTSRMLLVSWGCRHVDSGKVRRLGIKVVSLWCVKFKGLVIISLFLSLMLGALILIYSEGSKMRIRPQT